LPYAAAAAGWEARSAVSNGHRVIDLAVGGVEGADRDVRPLEGTSEIAVAEAQARALVDLLASYVTDAAAAAPPQALLAVDEFSAVSRRLPIWQLYERASLGLAVQVSARSWHGVAVGQDDRYRKPKSLGWLRKA